MANKEMYRRDARHFSGSATDDAINARRFETVHVAMELGEAVFQSRHLPIAVDQQDCRVVEAILRVPAAQRYWASNHYSWPAVPSPLIPAVKSGNLQMVSILLKYKLSPNPPRGSAHDQSPLFIAASMDHELMVWQLLEAGAHVLNDLPLMADLSPVPFEIVLECIKSNKDGGAAKLAKTMMVATKNNNVLLLDILKIFGGDFNVPYQGHSLLYYAALHSHWSTFVRLVARGAKVKKEPNGETLLHAARDADIAKWLLKRGAVVDAPAAGLATPLVAACMAGCLEVVEVLLDAGADVQGLAIPPDNLTAREYVRLTNASPSPLHIAARFDDQHMTRLLLERGANPLLERGPSVVQARPAVLPSRYVYINQLRMMLKVSTRPLDEAAAFSLGCLRLIRQIRVVLNKIRSDGQSLAHMIMYLHPEEVLRELAEMGVDFGARDDAGETILHRAARNCSGEEMYKFCNLSLDLNILNNKGQTALMVACYRPRTGAAETLIECGANAHIRVRQQRKGEDAFLIALRKKIGPPLAMAFLKEGIEPWEYTRFKLNRAMRRRLNEIIQLYSS